MLAVTAAACGFFVVLFTMWAAFATSRHGGQSVRSSMAEAWTNIAIGFAINYTANLFVLPLAGFDVGYGGAFMIGVVFTAISVARSFFIRRFYNWRQHRKP